MSVIMQPNPTRWLVEIRFLVRSGTKRTSLSTMVTIWPPALTVTQMAPLPCTVSEALLPRMTLVVGHQGLNDSSHSHWHVMWAEAPELRYQVPCLLGTA